MAGPSELEIYMLSFLCLKENLFCSKAEMHSKVEAVRFFSSSMRVGVFVLLSLSAAMPRLGRCIAAYDAA